MVGEMRLRGAGYCEGEGGLRGWGGLQAGSLRVGGGFGWVCGCCVESWVMPAFNGHMSIVCIKRDTTF